ncbi:MAG: outer membrane protein assembly factor BamD, partial [Thermodesulfobacteriota bacterium]
MPVSKGKFLIITLIIFLSASCGKKQIEQTADSQQLYQDAMEELEEDKGGFPWIFTGTDYDTIFKIFKEIQLRDPYGPYATLAELRTADTYFKKEEYEQAVIEYEEFLKRHPGHEESSYATYRLALSHYKLM